jgi:hypothetical protein
MLKRLLQVLTSIKNGYSIIHIYQKEVWNDTYDWKQVLRRVINYLENQQSCLSVFISCETKYVSHIEKLDSSINYKIVNPKNLEL